MDGILSGSVGNLEPNILSADAPVVNNRKQFPGRSGREGVLRPPEEENNGAKRMGLPTLLRPDGEKW